MGISQGTGSPKFSSFYGGQGQHKLITGAYVLPQGYANPNAVTVTVTATRLYYVPFAINRAKTYAGAAMWNNDTAASGQKARIMVFDDNGAANGPGALVKSFGEITFGATAIKNVLSSSWAANEGLYWYGLWFDSATVMQGMWANNVETAVGVSIGPNLSNIHGVIGGTNSSSGHFQAHRVDTTYGSAPVTAVAPTATILSSVAPATPLVPLVQLIG